MASKSQPQLTPRPVASAASSLRGCPICCGKKCEVLHEQQFVLAEGHPLAKGYSVVVCARCGFVYADTQVSQADYDAFYARFSKYEDTKTSTGGGGSAEDALRLKEMAACIAQTIPDRNARLVDIGCANGGLLKELRALGYSNLVGIDPSPACVEATKSLCSAEAHVGSLSALPRELGKFDGVILSHVLEHVQDLAQAVKAIGSLTARRGVAYIEVPDASRYAECLLAPFQDFNTEHINHFSPRGLRNLFAAHGWAEESAGAKTLEAAPGMPYPAAFGFFAKAPASAGPIALKKDSALRGLIADYIALSRAMMTDIDERIRRVLKKNQSVIVWGTGQLAMKLLGETCLGTANIAAFVDGNPVNQGKVLRGRPILAPDKLPGSSHPIIITSIIQGWAIARAIERQQLPNPVVFLAN